MVTVKCLIAFLVSKKKEKKEKKTQKVNVKLKPITKMFELITAAYVIEVYIRKTDSSIDPGLPAG